MRIHSFKKIDQLVWNRDVFRDAIGSREGACDIMKKRRRERTLSGSFAVHFGKHCPRTKANEHAEVRPRLEEQLDTREPSRLQSSLYRILRVRKWEKAEEGWRREAGLGQGGGTKTKTRAGRENVHNGENRKFEPIHRRKGHLLRQRARRRSCPARTALRRRKADRKRGLLAA